MVPLELMGIYRSGREQFPNRPVRSLKALRQPAPENSAKATSFSSVLHFGLSQEIFFFFLRGNHNFKRMETEDLGQPLYFAETKDQRGDVQI